MTPLGPEMPGPRPRPTEANPMKRIALQLDERMRRAAAGLDSLVWSTLARPAPAYAAITAKPAFAGMHTATDVPARRPQEPPP